MSKELSHYVRATGRDRNQIRELVKATLPPEQYKISKGLMWVLDDGEAAMETAIAAHFPVSNTQAETVKPETKTEHGIQEEGQGRQEEGLLKPAAPQAEAEKPLPAPLPSLEQPDVITALFLPGAKNPRFEYARTEQGEKIGVLVPSRSKGKYYGKKMKVEVFTDSDGTKNYRLLCAAFQKIA